MRSMRDERGSTLLEVIVGMLISLIFLGIFTGAIVLVYQSSNRANALTVSASQTDAAFARLDRTIRYSAAISTPGSDSLGWYVEYLTATNAAGGTATCTQLWVNTSAQQLQARTWPQGSTAATPWIAWASGITNGNAAAGSAKQPFVLVVNGTNVGYEQLTVNLAATAGSPALLAQTNGTFIALDSAPAVKTAGNGTVSTCTEVARP